MTEYERLARRRKGYVKKLNDLEHRTNVKITQGASALELSKFLELAEAEVSKFMKVHEEMEELVEDEEVQDTNQALWSEVTEKLVNLTVAVKSSIEKDGPDQDTGSKAVRVGTKVKVWCASTHFKDLRVRRVQNLKNC